MFCHIFVLEFLEKYKFYFDKLLFWCLYMYMDMIVQDYFPLTYLYKVDSATRDSNSCCDDLFMGVVPLKGGQQGGVNV